MPPWLSLPLESLAGGRQLPLAMPAARRKQRHHLVHTIRRRQPSPAPAMTELAAWPAATLLLPPTLALHSGQSIGGWRLGGGRRVLPPPSHLALQVGDLFLGLAQLLLLFDQLILFLVQLLAKSFIFTLQPLVLTFQPLAPKPSSRSGTRANQARQVLHTYTLPGFEHKSQVYFGGLVAIRSPWDLNCYGCLL